MYRYLPAWVGKTVDLWLVVTLGRVVVVVRGYLVSNDGFVDDANVVVPDVFAKTDVKEGVVERTVELDVDEEDAIATCVVDRLPDEAGKEFWVVVGCTFELVVIGILVGDTVIDADEITVCDVEPVFVVEPAFLVVVRGDVVAELILAVVVLFDDNKLDVVKWECIVYDVVILVFEDEGKPHPVPL